MDIEQFAERDERAMERIADSLESIADSLVQWCKLSQARFDREFPVKRNPLDATITRVPNDEDRLRESLGASEETLEEWTGEREQRVILEQSSQTRKAAGTSRVVKEPSGSGQTQGVNGKTRRRS